MPLGHGFAVGVAINDEEKGPRRSRGLTDRRSLHCGSMAILVLEHSERSGVLRLGRTFRDHGHRLRIVELHRGDPFPVDLDDVDGIVTAGGPQSANDDSLPWMAQELDLLREANEAQMPIVGLCLGCQILARALGGEVGPLENGPAIGWHEVRLNHIGREDPLHAGIAWRSMQPHWQNDEVKVLPAGARVLASSARCKIATWALDLRTYGFQFHPEIEPESFDSFAQDEPDALERAGISREQLTEETGANWPVFERLTSRLFAQIALLLMPVDRRFRGLVKDLHH